MKINPSLIWNLIGDGFGRSFDIREKRPVEAVWQGMFEMAKDAVVYTDHIASLENPFTAKAFAPWGKIMVYPELIESSKYFQSFIVGDRVIWSAFDIPEKGFIKNNNTSIEYRVISSRASFGGFLYFVEYLNNGVSFNSSSSFSSISEFSVYGTGSKTETPVGLLCNVDWVNWVILLQKKKVSSLKSWSQRWFTKVTNWDSGATTKRSISINSIGDIGVSYELRLEDDGSNAYISYGARAITRYVPLVFSGNTITRTAGSFIDDGFKIGQEFSISNATNSGNRTVSSVTSKIITVSGAPFSNELTNNAILRSELTTIGNIDTNIWRNKLRRASEVDPVYVDFDIKFNSKTSTIEGTISLDGQSVSHLPMSIMSCERYNGIDIFNQRNNIKIYLEGVSLYDGMMADGSSSDSTTVGENYAFIYQIQEPIVNCSRLQIDAWDMNIQAEILDISEDSLKIEIDEYFYSYAPDVILVNGSVMSLVSRDKEVAVYELKIGSISNLKNGQVITIKPWSTYEFQFISDSVFATKNPIYSDAIFLSGAEAREVDLYSRFGKVLDIHPEEDSDSYLSFIRGAQFMRMSPPNYKNIQNAISIMGGAPFAKFSGVLTSSNPIRNELGGIIRYQALVGENSIDYHPYWDQFLKNNGSKIETLQSIIADPVRVYDWRNGLDLILNRVPSWSAYGTALILINDTIGFSENGSSDLIKSLRRSLPKDTDFIVEYTSDRSEVLSNQNKNRFYQEVEYSNENIATIVDDLGFPDYGEVVQNGLKFQTIDGEMYSEEYQQYNPLTLDGGASLDETRTLDADWYRYTTILDRKNKKEGIYDSPKGYSLLWVYEGSSDTLATYNSGQWYEQSIVSGSTTYSDCYIDENNFFFATGSNGKIYESVDGFNWSGKTVTSSTGTATRVKQGWAFGFSSGVIQSRDISGNWSEVSVSGVAGKIDGVDVIDDNVYIFWVSGTTIYMKKSSDGGSTWGSAISVYAAGGAIDVVDSMFFSSTNGIVITSNDGILFTNDSGATWTQHASGVGFTRPGKRTSSEVYIGEDSSNNYRIISDFNGSSMGISSSVSIGIAGNIEQFIGGERYMFVLISGDVYRSNDYGATWSLAMTGITGNVNSIGSSEDGLTRMAAGDEIWKWS